MLTPRGLKSHLPEHRFLVGILLLAGCTHWHTDHVSPVGFLISKAPNRIRVTRVDHSRVVLHNPLLVGDTIVDSRPKDASGTKVPLNDVAEVAIRKCDPLATIGLVLGTAVVGASAAFVAAWHYPD